mmetsp:Transcript_35762/g.114990  ORF Transcript_35762/g.114990 Transcript_35762/m.114990 type:complete len:192 (-) Transcript_35762:456-1031(-)
MHHMATLFWQLVLVAAVGAAEINSAGPCVLLALPDGTGEPDCIASSNYDNVTGARVGNYYGEGESCTFTGVPELPLVSVEFFARGALPDKDYYYSYYDTGPGEGACGEYSDALEVNGERFCGPNGPEGVIASGIIGWTSYVHPNPVRAPWIGWKVCWSNAPPISPPSPSPPSPSPPPPPSPLPPSPAFGVL